MNTVRRLTLVALLMLLVLPGVARADRPFSQRFSANTQGDIAIAANGVLSCVETETGCPEARSGTGTRLNNNDRVMAYVDVDGDPSTFNSSDAVLSLPAGARVLFAGLYWGGRSSAGTGGLPAPGGLAARGTVLLRPPGAVGYQTIAAPSPVDEAGTNEYQAFADVTSIVDAAGPGVYRVGNVQVGTGRNASQSHGWALVVVYGDPAAPTRNLSVFDGFQNVSSSSAGVSVSLSGFQTPLSGAVNSTVGIVAQEGDLGTTGDGATIRRANGTRAPLFNAANPLNPPNLFNSSLSRAGTPVSDGFPNHANTFGFDVDTFVTDQLGNDQTSTEVLLTTAGDAYIPGVVTIATDLYAPRIAATKAVDKAEAGLGEELTYTTRFSNDGEDGAAGFVVTDPIPDGTTYVPGSLAIDGVAQTDDEGDDRAEFDAFGGRVVARLGAGASASAGGALATGAASAVTFRVRIDDGGFAAGAEIANVARAAFRAETTGLAFDPVASAPATTRLLLPDLTILKTHSPAYVAGGTSTILIGVFNFGEGPTTGETVVTDTLPAGLTAQTPLPPAAPWACGVSGQTITCRRTDPLPPVGPNDPQPIITVPVAVAPGTPVGSLANTATVANASDPNPDNNSVTDEGAVSEPQFDLRLDKRVTSTPVAGVPGYFPGATVTYELRVSNDGVQPAPGVRLVDTLPAGLELDPANPPTTTQGSCSGSTCELGTIAPGAEVVVTVTALLGTTAAGYVSDAELVNRAEVSGTGMEVDPTNNVAEGPVTTLPEAEISVEKEVTPQLAAIGGPVTYTITVRNNGPDMVDIAVGDLVPAEVLDPVVGIEGGTGECTPVAPFPNAPQLQGTECAIPQFEVGGTRTITVRGRVGPVARGTTVTNFAGTLGLLVDFDMANNDDDATFTTGVADVGIVKTRVGSGEVPVGGEAVFRLVARNQGDAAGTGVDVRDVLPAGLAPVAAPGCSIAGQEVVCRIDELGAGEERAFEVRALAEPSAAGRTLVNRGTVTVLAADPVAANDASEASVTVAPLSAVGAPPPVVVETECRSKRRFTIRLIERRGRAIRRAVVRVDGKRVAVARRRSDHRLVAVVDLRGLPKGTYHVRITARLRDGRRVRWVRSYRTCAGELPPSNRLLHPRAI